MRIGVFGLGYVGSVSMGCLAALGHEVIGVDVDTIKTDLISAGRSPVIEAGLDDLITEGIKAGRIRATRDTQEAIANADLSLVCVGTPSAENGDVDLSFVTRACQDIGLALRARDDYHVVVVRSTVLPGSTEEQLIPALEDASGQEAGRDFGVCFNPEFLREGTGARDFQHPPFTLIGQYDSRGSETTARIYEGLDAPLLIVPVKVAEMVKYTNNAFHALKVAFANEIGSICKQQGIDSHQIMDIFCMDDKLNLSPYYLKPAYAFGGPCLPKDLRALLHHSHRLDLRLPVLEAILPSNELQIQRGFDLIRQTGQRKIGVLGLGFKAGTDDLRESPLVTLIEFLIGKGYQVKIYDQNVSLSQLRGANRTYIEREIPHIASLVCQSIEELLAECEVIVIGNKGPEFASVLKRVRQDQTIVDLVRITEEIADLKIRYEGIGW